MRFPSSEAPAAERFESPYFYFSNDRSGVLTFLSESVEDVLGYRPANELGRNFNEFLVTDHVENSLAAVDHAERFRTTQVQSITRAIHDCDGGVHILYVQTYGESDLKGKVIRSRGCAQEITSSYQQNQLIKHLFDELSEKKSRLDEREQFVLSLVAQGYLNKQIAKRLSVSLRTVENVRTRILDALEVDHVSAAIAIESQIQLLADLVDTTSSESQVRHS